MSVVTLHWDTYKYIHYYIARTIKLYDIVRKLFFVFHANVSFLRAIVLEMFPVVVPVLFCEIIVL